MDGRLAILAARVAAQLAREDAGRYQTVKEISANAVALADSALRARAAIEHGRNPGVHFARAKAIAAAYHAELVPNCDVDGMVIGLRFTSGRFTNGAANVFYLA
jgi:hypothetical protein